MAERKEIQQIKKSAEEAAAQDHICLMFDTVDSSIFFI
jgi:hypothetical protein